VDECDDRESVQQAASATEVDGLHLAQFVAALIEHAEGNRRRSSPDNTVNRSFWASTTS
jgi:hypothetical protein